MVALTTIRIGSTGPSVRILQMNLIGLAMNYNGLQVTGVFDTKTHEIVQNFQAENKLYMDGVVGPVTWRVLFQKIIAIQNRLNARGFNTGYVDGIFGAQTTNAVTRFQRANGLFQEGIVNPRTRQKLFNPYPTDNYSERPSSTSLSALHPYVANLAQKFLDKCKASGLDVRIIITFRSWDEQDRLFAQGRTAPGDIVTDARGGDSYHNWGLAFDCGPVVNGQIAWEDTDKFIKMGHIGESVGLEWGGNWTSYYIALVDYPHFQYTFGLSTEQLLNGARPPM